MKIINEIIMLSAVAIVGYVLWKIWQNVQATGSAVTKAATTTANTVAAWTPAGIGSSIAGDASAAYNSIVDFINGGSTAPAVAPVTPVNTPVLQNTADLAGYNALADSLNTSAFSPFITTFPAN